MAKKRIILTPKDHLREITLTGEKQLINLRVFYSSKGFGIEIFSDLPVEKSTTEHDQEPFQIFIGDKYKTEADYVGVWKLDKITTKRVKKASKKIRR